jgi:hypothetical protein
MAVVCREMPKVYDDFHEIKNWLWRDAMPGNRVNLDALIPRQDMETGEVKPANPGPVYRLKHAELEYESNTYQVLRKPDFQRETSSWTPEKVRDLIVAYATEALVPAIILWPSPTNDLFVIDGAHRLSSLIAWMQDDYGDGDLSRAFFGAVPEHQRASAQRTKELVEEAVGPWKDIAVALHPSNSDPRYKDIAKVLNNCFVTVQPLITADVIQAEKSFFKINEQGVPLSETDKILLHSRRCPNSIAARAINQQGTGHPHWKQFSDTERKKIETIAKDVYKCLFTPLSDSPTLKAENPPVAGRYSPSTAVGLLLQAVNQANGVDDTVPSSKEEAEAKVPPDQNGKRTAEFLRNTRTIITTISNREDTDHMRSLDLHPFVYFYSDRGKHQPVAFLATVELIASWKQESDFFNFTMYRAAFEDFLLKHKDFIQQIVRITRGQLKAVHSVKHYLQFVLKQIEAGADHNAVVSALLAQAEFEQLKVPVELTEEEEEAAAGADISVGTKSQIIIADKLNAAVRCFYCKARVSAAGISFDHKKDKKYHGKGNASNLVKAHHFCNGSKDKLIPLLTSEVGA